MVRRNRNRCMRKEILASTGALRREYHSNRKPHVIGGLMWQVAAPTRPGQGLRMYEGAAPSPGQGSNQGLRVINGRIAAGRRSHTP